MVWAGRDTRMPLRGGRIGLAKGLIRHVRRGTRQVQASHKVSAVFDDPNLIGSAGLVPVMRLAERAGLHDLLQEHLSVANPNAAVKAAGVIAGMLAGADSIDDLGVLRHGGMTKVFTGVKAPSTYGTFLLLHLRARPPARRGPLAHPGRARPSDTEVAGRDRGDGVRRRRRHHP